MMRARRLTQSLLKRHPLMMTCVSREDYFKNRADQYPAQAQRAADYGAEIIFHWPVDTDLPDALQVEFKKAGFKSILIGRIKGQYRVYGMISKLILRDDDAVGSL